MSTPYSAFAKIAARLGGVDRTDAGAVQRWFVGKVPLLPPRQIEEILVELLEADGTPQPEPVDPTYPKDAPLPTLADSPEAGLGGRWSEFRAAIWRVLRRRG